jgi:Bacterial SH3 domain
MIGKSTTRTKLCPYCANSVPEDATNCAYCKADFASEIVPQWLKRDKAGSEPRNSSANQKGFSIPPNFVWLAAILIVALAAFFAGGYLQRSQLQLSTQAFSKQLQAKNQMIQTQETQLAQTRQQLNENSTQLAEMKTKLEESQKELAIARQRAGTAARELDRLHASRSQSVTRTASRAPATARSLPPPVARTAEAGVYETTRPTSVYENPSSASTVISQIDKGTRINVVNSTGDWLQVRSKRGNPPGYVRSDDARQIARAN